MSNISREDVGSLTILGRRELASLVEDTFKWTDGFKPSCDEGDGEEDTKFLLHLLAVSVVGKGGI